MIKRFFLLIFITLSFIDCIATNVKTFPIECGDIVYARIDGKIMAMKLFEIEYHEYNRKSIFHFYCADKNIRQNRIHEMLHGSYSSFPIYYTIEDCKNGNNDISIITKNISEKLIKDCGFEYKNHRLCLIRYYFNGYSVQEREFSLYYLNIYVDKNNTYYIKKRKPMSKGEMLVAEKEKDIKYYNTYEECYNDNKDKVQILTF